MQSGMALPKSLPALVQSLFLRSISSRLLCCNFLSIKKLTFDLNCYLIFDECDVSIKAMESERTLLHGAIWGGLYHLSMPSSPDRKATLVGVYASLHRILSKGPTGDHLSSLFQKLDVFHVFVKFCTFVEHLIRVNICTIQSDYGSEFTSNIYSKWFWE